MRGYALHANFRAYKADDQVSLLKRWPIHDVTPLTWACDLHQSTSQRLVPEPARIMEKQSMRSLETDPISLPRLSKLLASAGPSAGLARKKKIRHFWILYPDESPLSKRHSYNNRSIFHLRARAEDTCGRHIPSTVDVQVWGNGPGTSYFCGLAVVSCFG